MTAQKDTYYIARTGTEIIHHGFSPAGTQIDTGQPEFECFDTKPEYLSRLQELGIQHDEESP